MKTELFRDSLEVAQHRSTNWNENDVTSSDE